MNYLAHLFLADDSSDSLLGNLAGDFVKGPLHDRFTPGIRAGIMQHRRIDAYTDSHPKVAAFRAVLAPEHGHYSRIISDVFFDHFLACSFEEYAGETLEAFLARVYERLDPRIEEMPERLRSVYPRIRDGQWLLSYRDIASIATALAGISRRLSRQPRLETAARHLNDSRGILEPLFRSFFPELIRHAATLR